MAHGHTHGDGGWFAANMMAFLIGLVVLVALVIGIVAWQPWDTGSSDGDGGGIDIDIGGGEGRGSGDGGGD